MNKENLSLEPYSVAFMGDKSGGELIFRKTSGILDPVVLKVTLPFEADVLEAHKCESFQDYYLLEVAPVVQQELEFSDGQMRLVEDWLISKGVLRTL